MNILKAAMAGALVLGTAAPALSQVQPGCVPACGTDCIKPFSIPDRWDDITPITGYTGGSKRPNWRNNASWDNEALTNDVNGNGLYDPGDGYIDGNGNGMYDAEAYDPVTTGYIADPRPSNVLAPGGDLGMEITLIADNDAKPSPGQYLVFDLPAVNRGVPVPGGDEFRNNLAVCNAAFVGPSDRLQLEAGNMVGPANQGMRDLIAQDPDAYWDPISMSVQGSKFPFSPRVVFIPVHDPRLPISGLGPYTITTRKVVAFFMEQMEGNAEVRGRFLRVTVQGPVCTDPFSDAGFLVTCPTPAQSTTWGRVKDLYR